MWCAHMCLMPKTEDMKIAELVVALSTFALSSYIRPWLLFSKSYAIEQKCKQWHQQRFAHSQARRELLMAGTCVTDPFALVEHLRNQKSFARGIWIAVIQIMLTLVHLYFFLVSTTCNATSNTIRVREIIACVVSSLVSFSNHRPCLETCSGPL